MMNGRGSDRRYVLVVGGTGMLRRAGHELIGRGHGVLAVARRPARGAPVGDGPGEYVPVEADWSRPEALGDAIRAELDGRGVASGAILGAIVWVHSPHRQAVLDQLEGLLEPGATVLQVWGSAATDPREVMAKDDGCAVRPWRARHLYLGYQRDERGARWLTDEEISGAAVRAWDGDGGPSLAGQVDPWEHHP